MQRVQAGRAGPRAGERGQRVAARRVVDHLAEIVLDAWPVHQAPVLLQILNQEKVMCQIRPGAERQK